MERLRIREKFVGRTRKRQAPSQRLLWTLPPWTLFAGFAWLTLGGSFTDVALLSTFLPALLILLGARSLDGRLREAKLPALLGDASYALYLSHPLALQIAKKALYASEDMDYFRQFDLMNEAFARLCSSDDAKEGVKAFFEKRAAVWKVC